MTLVICDHIDWKSWKLIVWAISPTSSLFAAKRRSTYSQGTWENLGETRGGVGEKWRSWRTKAAISLKRVKMEEKLLWRAYRNSPALFRTVPYPTPYGLPFFEVGGLQLIDLKLRISNFLEHSYGRSEQKPMKNVGNSICGRSQGVPKFFRAPMYKGHCAVIFAIAQVSCCYSYCYYHICPIHTADADETKLSSRVASAV